MMSRNATRTNVLVMIQMPRLLLSESALVKIGAQRLKMV